MAKISIGILSLGGPGLALCQIITTILSRYLKIKVKTILAWKGCFQIATSFSLGLLVLKNAYLQYKIRFLGYFAELCRNFLQQRLWIIPKFGMAITDICGDVTGEFVLPRSNIISNQEV